MAEKRSFVNKLRSHPGLPMAMWMTVLGFLAGIGTPEMNVLLGLIGATLMGGFTFLIVILTALED